MENIEKLVEITESCLEDLGSEKYSYSSELGERKYHYELFDNIYANIIVKIEEKFVGTNYRDTWEKIQEVKTMGYIPRIGYPTSPGEKVSSEANFDLAICRSGRGPLIAIEIEHPVEYSGSPQKCLEGVGQNLRRLKEEYKKRESLKKAYMVCLSERKHQKYQDFFENIKEKKPADIRILHKKISNEEEQPKTWY